MAIALIAMVSTAASAGSVTSNLRRGVLREGNGNSTANDLRVTTNGGFVNVSSNEDVSLGSYSIEDVEQITIRAGTKDDSVYVDVSHFPDLDIVTGFGEDDVEVRGCIEDLRIDTGALHGRMERICGRRRTRRRKWCALFTRRTRRSDAV